MDNDKVFSELKSLLAPYAERLTVVHDKSNNYYLNTPITAKNKKGEFFGAVQIKKSYVAFHLMPVYCHPELLDDISSALKKKMQGKSCFNFKSVDEQLFEEIKLLIKNSFEKYQSENKV